MILRIVMASQCWKYLRGIANSYKAKLSKPALATGPCDYKCHTISGYYQSGQVAYVAAKRVSIINRPITIAPLPIALFITESFLF
jgi:hypothetical protein